MTEVVGADPTSPEWAAVFEETVADNAREIRGEATKLDPALFLKLWPMLTEPIPPAYVQTVGSGAGKPYVSTGIKSVQVQIDRMNNVLTPMWWWQEVEYEQGGKLCHVKVYAGARDNWTVYSYGGEGVTRRTGVLAEGESWGGVDRGNTVGNTYKGSYTNAAKRAFAALGVGHEIYLGMADLDPDVSEELAQAGEQGGGRELATQLYEQTKKLGLLPKLQLTASHVAGRDVGDCGTKAKAVKALATLTPEEMSKLDARLQAAADKLAEAK